jgi:dihydrofolate reductase/thymidylate synthase
MLSTEIILAVDNHFGIAKNSTIPWHIRDDFHHFRSITSNHIILMGSKTWESLPCILPNRIHIVFTQQENLANKLEENDRPFVLFFKTITSFIDFYHTDDFPENWKSKKLFIIGGQKFIQNILHFSSINPHSSSHFISISKIHLSHIPHNFHCDTFFPKLLLQNYSLHSAAKKDLSTPFAFLDSKGNSKTINHIFFYDYQFTSNPHPELIYTNLIRSIFSNGSNRHDRTLIGTKSLFGYQMRIPIRNHFPLLTSKKMFWKGIVEELLWFLRGETNLIPLQQKGVHIWDGNTSPEYLESIGLSHYQNGECGPIYGFQFRHFGATYINSHTDYTGQGFDQVAEVLRMIHEEPTSRRIMISLWNPPDLNKQILPPCHVLYQFYVNDETNELSCSLYQRSGDVGLGIPFNIASASLMTYIFAHLTGLKPGELIHSIGDAHIYNNHLAGMEEQLSRPMYPWPKLKIKELSSITGTSHQRVEDYTIEDFELMGYFSEDSIKMKMAT